MNENLSAKLTQLPDNPGVYLMKNKQKRIIYVGKAISLKKRVRSYFSGEKDIKTRILVSNIDDIEFIVTSNEQEALILENNLIKQWKPRYNINLKDGKTYPVIRITHETFPRIFRTRRIILDGSFYFGPYSNVNQVEIYLKIIEGLYPLRKCKDRDKPKKRTHPCLYYHIHRCKGPCCAYISKEDYAEDVNKIRKLLSGHSKELAADFEKKMQDASAALEFEKAVVFRDQFQAIRQFGEVQRIVDFKAEARDYIGFYAEDIQAAFIILQMRDGKLTGREIFHTEIYNTPDEALIQFFLQYYGQINIIPAQIYLPLGVAIDQLNYFMEKQLEKKVKIFFPKKGKHLRLITMANENARVDIQKQAPGEKVQKRLEQLQSVLGLRSLPRRIEGFDISHLAGKHMVGAMVSFHDGQPDKKCYRYFKIKTLASGQIDDFEAIREAVARRYTRVLNDNLERPDLILIDGGKGQLHAASEILKALSFEDIPVIGLAKRNEEIFTVHTNAPIIIDKTNPALQLLQAVRDESHRFGIKLNRRLTLKETATSIFEGIKGIGKKKSRELLIKYGSLENILKDKPENIAKVAGINEETTTALINLIRTLIKR